MKKKIAVFVNEFGETAAVSETGIVKVYEKDDGKWVEVKQIPLNIDSPADLTKMRENILNVSDEIGNCKVFVGRSVSGLLYTIFEKKGINLWEMDGKPEDFLDYIIEKEQQEEAAIKEASEKKAPSANPIEKRKDGYYYIDLKKLQESNTGITSKQALLSFLNKEVFYELEIICNHIPPWFEGEFKKLNLAADVEKRENNEYKIRVYHKTC